jgi:hypothetical protein
MPATCQYGQLSPSQLAHDLAIPDLSDPADGPHAIQQLTGLAAASLASAWNLEPGDQVRWCRGPRVVPVADNYDRLGYDPADITRAVRYTRYVDDQTMQRSHATAMVPPALRQLARDRAADVLLVCPGITYRRDVIDWQHSGTPHQLDLWRISRLPLAAADPAWRRGRNAACIRPPPMAGRSTSGPIAAGSRSVSAGWPIRMCWPGRGWLTMPGWRSGSDWTGC